MKGRKGLESKCVLLFRVIVPMTACTDQPQDDFHKRVCMRVCVCYRLYISLKLFILHKESLLRILLMLEIFIH